MKTTLLALVLSLAGFSASATTFEPYKTETSNYKVWANRIFKHYIDHSLGMCKFETRLNAEGTAIELRMGVEGSNFDYFGVDADIPLSEFPLKDHYRFEFKPAGGSWMVLTYEKNTLRFEFMKKNGLWTMIFPFELSIDPELKAPKTLDASVEGYAKDMFGNPKKNLSQHCVFN